jgi:hypothetical protein
MYDYCWIIDSDSRTRKWEMEYPESEHAGGSVKNRLFNQIVPFEKGNYMIYCVTDENHSSQDWNDAPPYDTDNWGLSILTTGEKGGTDVVKPFSEKRKENVLAKISPVGNGERRREWFEMPVDGYVDIYALGEGMNGEMFDYAWIEAAASHEMIWEMNFIDSSHAGGAQKNREISKKLYLDKGEYLLYYQSDATHAFGAWNEAPPNDPASWGAIITLSEETPRSL